MSRTHSYPLSMVWTGNLGPGTSSYRAYSRDHEISAAGKPVLVGSSDPVFRGDAGRWNPEELLVASLATCHMLGYLHQAALAGVVVTAYQDDPEGEMTEDDADGGRFTQVLLRPRVTVANAEMVATAEDLHQIAHAKCFIASSVNFPVRHQATTAVAGDQQPARV